MSFQYIFFDLDGTITESGPGIIASVRYSLEKMGYPSDDTETLKKFIGPPLKDSYMRFYGMTREQAEEAICCYREYYADKGIFENALYEGITDSLRRLKDAGKKLVIATSKPEKYAKMIAEHFGFAVYFDEICGATMDEKLVEKADIIAYAMDKLDLKPENQQKILMVGDRKHDILGAKANGLKSMGVLFGYGDQAELEEAGADWIVSTPSEVAVKILAAE